MNVIGTVVKINLNTEIEKKDGGTYPGFILVYEDNKNGEVKKLAKHANTLKYNKSLKQGLESLSVDDVFTMEMKKSDAGFWEPISIVKGEVAQTTTSSGNTSRPQTNSGGGNWPTAEERAQTQVHIIRQNCVTNAVNFVVGAGVKKDLTTENVLKVAKQFEQFVHTGDTGSVEDLPDNDLDSGVE